MKTEIDLHNDHYDIRHYGSEGNLMMEGSGPYCNFIKEINTLDDWFASFDARDGAYEVNDFRDNKNFDPITVAKRQRKERLEREEEALSSANDATTLVQVAKELGMPRIKAVFELRKRFSNVSVDEGKELYDNAKGFEF